MRERSWPYAVRDARGKRHRGVISYGDGTPKQPPEPPVTFRIALLDSAVTVRQSPGATAVCVPHLSRAAALVEGELQSIPREIAAIKLGRMSEARHAQYRAGTVVIPSGEIDPAKVFLRGAKVDFEHLALVLVELQRVEALAPYLAIIRHELGMPPSSNALLALQTRLYPADPDERPPARAPGVARLRKALKRLEAGDAPDLTLDELTSDLRFLRVFERTEHVLRRAALDRLLSEVASPRPRPIEPVRAGRGRIIKLRPRRDA